MAESESRRAGDEAESKYREAFNVAVGAEEKDMQAEHIVRTCRQIT